MKKKISVVVPCYNEEEALSFFYKKIKEISEEMDSDFELIFVDDGSIDKTLDVLKGFSQSDKSVRYISFSRNFGKEAAMYAGLEASNGDLVAVMDADLQDPPELLIDMYNEIKNNNYDVVAAKRRNRKGEPVIRSFFARKFYKIISRMSNTQMVDGARDFRLMKRKVVDAIINMGEYNRYSKGIFSFVGFKTKWLEYDNVERIAGTSKWSFWKLFIYALEAIVSFSTKPLITAAFIGVLFCFIAFCLIIFIIVRTLIWSDPVGGWPSLVCIIFMVSGVQLFCTGIIGIYLSKTYLETKKRPIYIVRETDKDM